eukprot:1431056-Amphidinium_carterae.1
MSARCPEFADSPVKLARRPWHCPVPDWLYGFALPDRFPWPREASSLHPHPLQGLASEPVLRAAL